MAHPKSLTLAWVLALGLACLGQAPATVPPTPQVPGFHGTKLAEIDALIGSAIDQRATPGAVLWLERKGSAYHRAYGNRAILPTQETMTEDTIFDAASLTKVLATTPAILKLAESGRLAIDATVATYLPEFTGAGRDRITVRELLTHTSGLRPGLGGLPDDIGYAGTIQRALAEMPDSPAGSRRDAPRNTRFRYSDINFILLGEIVRRVAGESLDAFCNRSFYEPLGMPDTRFRPPAELRHRIAPTTLVDGSYLRGVVHDPTARRMGGVAGHAGLFTTAADLARFCRMLLNHGQLDGRRIFDAATVRLMTSVQSPDHLPEARRGLGWDIDSPYAGPRGEIFPVGSYGHTGWTGTSMWLDPFSGTFVLLLSNRNHPTEAGSVLSLRRQVGTAAAQAVEGFDFQSVPGALPRQPASDSSRTNPPSRPRADTAPVLNGIDVLKSRDFAPLRGRRVGLITNHTGTDRAGNSTIDLLHQAPDVRLVALFSPEHGIRGKLDDLVADGIDERTGLPVYSLYGTNRAPTPRQLDGVDALVFDIQDIGCRFYTYLSTMGLCLEAAAQHRLPFLVLDRVNPINGLQVEGPVRDPGTNSFVAFHSLPLRHGMTAGEMARLLNLERGLKAELTVVPIAGWKRAQWFDQTGIPWIHPSPNMRSLIAASLYPGVGLVEFAVSVGRGTAHPFEIVGAPYVDENRFAALLNDFQLPGVRFDAARFTPRTSVFQGKSCGGAVIRVTDRDALAAVDVGIAIASALHRLHPTEFAIDKLSPLLRHEATLAALKADRTLPEIKALWAADLEAFRSRRAPHLLYD